MSSDRDNNMSWAEQITRLLDELCELLYDYSFDNTNKIDIIRKETEIYELVDEYVPRLLPELDKFYDYIHECLRDDVALDEQEIEDYVTIITRRLYHRDDYALLYYDCSDDQNKYNLEIASGQKMQRLETEREFIHQMIMSNQTFEDEEQEKISTLTREDRIDIAKERKQNIISSIIAYLSSYAEPVPTEQIHCNVNKATRQLIDIVRKRTEVIDYKEKLLLGSKLKIDKVEKDLLKSAIQDTFFIDKVHTGEEIYRQLIKNHGTLLSDLYISNSYGLFSVLQYLYPNEFVFVRPRIALPGQTLTKPIESITRFICNRYKTNIDDLKEFIDDAGYDMTVSLSLINRIPDVIIADRNTLMSKANLSITSDQLIQFITLIQDELKDNLEEPDTAAIRDLTCSAKFPILNLPMTEWLVYSILTKWDWPGKNSDHALYAFSTSPHLSRAIPIVSTNQHIDAETRQAIAAKYEGTSDTKMAMDDLSNLDELIEDEIEFDWDLEALEEEEDEEI